MNTHEAEYIVIGKTARTPVITELLMRPVGPAAIRHLPGQYLLLADVHERLPARSYSIANAPRPDGTLSLLVTRVAGGELSTWVHRVLHPSDRVLVAGPYGAFTADPGDTGPMLLLAGGSGLAPVRALAEAAVHRDSTTPVVLFFSARTPQDLIDEPRLRSWQRRHPAFRYLRTLTREPGTPHRHIPALLPTVLPDLSDWHVYIAGAPGFVRACEKTVRELKARPGRVHTEEFFTEPAPRPAAAPVEARRL